MAERKALGGMVPTPIERAIRDAEPHERTRRNLAKLIGDVGANGISLKAGGNKKHKKADRGLNLYETHPAAVRALLAVEALPHEILEPACGPGAIVSELRAAGHKVRFADIKDYGLEGTVVRDFLGPREPGWESPAIVMNPPYGDGKDAEFVRRARELAPIVCALLRLNWLESKNRTDVLEAGDLRCVYQFRERLPMMHRAGWTGKKAGSAMAFAWYVWDRNYSGPIQVKRISWREHDEQAGRRNRLGVRSGGSDD